MFNTFLLHQFDEPTLSTSIISNRWYFAWKNTLGSVEVDKNRDNSVQCKAMIHHRQYLAMQWCVFGCLNVWVWVCAAICECIYVHCTDVDVCMHVWVRASKEKRDNLSKWHSSQLRHTWSLIVFDHWDMLIYECPIKYRLSPRSPCLPLL